MARKKQNIPAPLGKDTERVEYHDGVDRAYAVKLGSIVPGKGRVVTVAIRSIELLPPDKVEGMKGPEISTIHYRPVE